VTHSQHDDAHNCKVISSFKRECAVVIILVTNHLNPTLLVETPNYEQAPAYVGLYKYNKKTWKTHGFSGVVAYSPLNRGNEERIKERFAPSNLRLEFNADVWNRNTCTADRGASIRSRRRLPRVGPVPEDGIAVGHHFGARLLAKYTHPHHQAHEEDHFHLQHHYSRKTSRHVFLFNLGLRSAVSRWIGLSGTLQVGRVTCLRHMWSCGFWSSSRKKDTT
jgi:hypothetical protein